MKIVFLKRKKSWQRTFTSYSVILTLNIIVDEGSGSGSVNFFPGSGSGSGWPKKPGSDRIRIRIRIRNTGWDDQVHSLHRLHHLQTQHTMRVKGWIEHLSFGDFLTLSVFFVLLFIYYYIYYYICYVYRLSTVLCLSKHRRSVSFLTTMCQVSLFICQTFVCLSVNLLLSVCLCPLLITISQLSISLPTYFSTLLSILSIKLYFSFYLSIYLSTYLPVCLYIYLSMYLSMYLSIYISISPDCQSINSSNIKLREINTDAEVNRYPSTDIDL